MVDDLEKNLQGFILPGTIIPGEDDMGWPTHDSKYGKGGYKIVNTYNDLLSSESFRGIDDSRLSEGMLVYVIDSKKEYRYIKNNNLYSWQEVTSSIDSSSTSYTITTYFNISNSKPSQPEDGTLLSSDWITEFPSNWSSSTNIWKIYQYTYNDNSIKYSPIEIAYSATNISYIKTVYKNLLNTIGDNLSSNNFKSISYNSLINDGWTDTPNNLTSSQIANNYKTYSLYTTFSNYTTNNDTLDWSGPVCLTGANGENGKDSDTLQYAFIRTKEYNSNYQWFYRKNNDNVVYSYIDNISFDSSKNGVPGLKEDNTYDITFYYTDKDNQITNESSLYFTDSPIGITKEYRYEWQVYRNSTTDSSNNIIWSEFSIPTIRSAWGEDGIDGDGIEYIYKLTSDNNIPIDPSTYYLDISSEEYQQNEIVPNGWTDDPTGVSESNQYEWVAIRKSINGIWQVFSKPALWAKYGEKGEKGDKGDPGDSEDNYKLLITKEKAEIGITDGYLNIDIAAIPYYDNGTNSFNILNSDEYPNYLMAYCYNGEGELLKSSNMSISDNSYIFKYDTSTSYYSLIPAEKIEKIILKLYKGSSTIDPSISNQVEHYEIQVTGQAGHLWFNNEEEFNSIISDVENNRSAIKQTSDQISLLVDTSLKKCGIDISNGTIDLAAEQINAIADQVNVSGSLIAKELLTSPKTDEGKACIDASGALMIFNNRFGYKNLEIGLNDNGYIILKYYDNFGNVLFDLGPNGLRQMYERQEAWIDSSVPFLYKLSENSSIGKLDLSSVDPSIFVKALRDNTDTNDQRSDNPDYYDDQEFTYGQYHARKSYDGFLIDNTNYISKEYEKELDYKFVNILAKYNDNNTFYFVNGDNNKPNTNSPLYQTTIDSDILNGVLCSGLFVKYDTLNNSYNFNDDYYSRIEEISISNFDLTSNNGIELKNYLYNNYRYNPSNWLQSSNIIVKDYNYDSGKTIGMLYYDTTNDGIPTTSGENSIIVDNTETNNDVTQYNGNTITSDTKLFVIPIYEYKNGEQYNTQYLIFGYNS